MLHSEALHVVNALLPFFDFHGDVHVLVNVLLGLRDVHLFDVSHVICHLLDRHLSLLLTNDVLNLLQLAACDRSKLTKSQVADLFEDKIVFIGEAQELCTLSVPTIVLYGRRVDNTILDISVAAIDAKCFIDLPLVVLLDQEGRDRIDGSVEENHAVNLCICVASSCRVRNQLSSLDLVSESLVD